MPRHPPRITMQAQNCKVSSATKRNSSSGLHSRVSLPEVLFHLAGEMTALQGVSEASMAVYGMFHAPATLLAVSADYTEATERCSMAQSLPFSRPVSFARQKLNFFTLDARLLAKSQYSEGPATGHLDTGFSWFPCVYKQTLRWFPKFQVVTTCFSCKPPDSNLLVTSFILCMHVK